MFGVAWLGVVVQTTSADLVESALRVAQRAAGALACFGGGGPLVNVVWQGDYGCADAGAGSRLA
jgi:hypothetical protein